MTCGTKGGLVSKRKQSMKLVVTTNGEKSAEVIVPRRLQTSSNSYSELIIVDVADIWRESDVWYQGRSRQQAETEYETCSNNEWREVSRSHSTKTVANVKGRTEL